MTDNTVIMVLSETFSDPTRVPGVSFSEDPMPNIRHVKAQTTSGLMLSPGYGGGTANIEYQALSGLSMANYSSTLSIAYQQLVPSSNGRLRSIKLGTKPTERAHPSHSTLTTATCTSVI